MPSKLDFAAEAGKLAALLDAADVQPAVIEEAQSPAQRDAFKASGLDAATYFARLKTSKPHWFAQPDPNAEANADAAAKKHAAAKAAFGKPKTPSTTMKDRGAYIAAYGLDDYNRQMVAWSASTDPRVRGYNPAKKNSASSDGTEPDKKNKPAADDGKKRGKNPFDAANYAGTPEQARAAQIALIKSGTQRAVSLAKAANCDLAGRPLRTA